MGLSKEELRLLAKFMKVLPEDVYAIYCLIDEDHLEYSNNYARFRMLKKLCDGFESVLEVGCATGHIISRIEAKRKAGVDVSKVAIFLAKKRHKNVEFKVANATKLPFDDKSFDVVILPELIEHLNKRNAIKAIKEASRVAKNKIIITTPNGIHESPMHKQTFTIDSLRGLIYTALNGNYKELKIYGSGLALIDQLRINRILKFLNIKLNFNFISKKIPQISKSLVAEIIVSN
jgi:SAM-dependent methyltransferase